MDNVCSNKPKDMNSDCKETDFRISYPLHNMIYLKTTNPIPNIHYIHYDLSNNHYCCEEELDNLPVTL